MFKNRRFSFRVSKCECREHAHASIISNLALKSLRKSIKLLLVFLGKK